MINTITCYVQLLFVSDNGRQKIDEENEVIQLKAENSRLEVQVRSFSREVEELRRKKAENSESLSYGEMKLDLIQHKQELSRAKEALQGTTPSAIRHAKFK